MAIKINYLGTLLWQRSIISCWQKSVSGVQWCSLYSTLPSKRGLRNREECFYKNRIAERGGSVCQKRNASSNSISGDRHYDVIISGGGMVGTSMAAALGNEPSFKDKKILLLEEGSDHKLIDLPKDFNSRVCALSPATKNFLSSFGAWSGVEARRFQPVKRMQIWDSCSDSMITFSQDSMEQDLAYIAENDVILSAIMDQLEKVKGQNVNVRYRTKAKSYKLPSSRSSSGGSGWAEVELETGDILTSKLIVGADGFNSLLRKSAKIHSLKLDYKQTAVVSTVYLQEDTINNVAWQRFLPDGPIALLPLSNEASCLIWTTTPEHAKSLVKLPSESFVDAVNNAYWSDNSKNSLASYANQIVDNVIKFVGLEQPVRQLPPTVLGVAENSRKTFPLSLVHSTHYAAPRLALIGDAAHRVHPLAGQGVNLGFGDVACLTRILINAAYDGCDLGSLGHLMEYETERQRQAVPMMAGVDCINRLYSNSFTPLVLLRSIGCQATNALQPIKDQMVRFATS